MGAAPGSHADASSPSPLLEFHFSTPLRFAVPREAGRRMTIHSSSCSIGGWWKELQIPRLRFASVGMTKERVGFPFGIG